MNSGIARLNELPLSLRLLREIREILMSGVRGQDKHPGEFRQIPNRISSPANDFESAVFVAPIPEAMNTALDDLGRFMNEEAELPLLIKCALIHYQFETVHPFLDGNERLGRQLLFSTSLKSEDSPTRHFISVSILSRGGKKTINAFRPLESAATLSNGFSFS